MIQLKQVSKTYQNKKETVVALNNVDLEIKRGEIFGIIGLSGAGKSTLIRSINRLEIPQSGSIRIDDIEMTTLTGKELRSARRKIGMIFQHFNLLSSRTVFGNIAFPMEVAGAAPSAIKQRVLELAEIVGLSDKLQNYPSQLSGGQKQRVGIARALANRPEILLCDEATSALDPQTTHSILKLLRDLNQRLGLTIILITHEIQVVKEICDSVAIIENGRIVESGSLVQLFSNPQTDTAREFIRTATNDKIPENLQELIRSQTGLGTGKLLRIFFRGEAAKEPIISSLIRRFNLDVNILYANLDFVHDTPFGSLIVGLSGNEDEVPAAIAFLQEQGCRIEVLNGVEPATIKSAD
ncbi:MAG: methionine ABC transporter ATP-binding protein [Bacteroidota bacterium]